MKEVDVSLLQPGIYRLHWNQFYAQGVIEGQPIARSSLAAVGLLKNGRRWYAVVDWIVSDPAAVASTNWRRVERAERV